MRKWDALNDRQLRLLRRIADGDDLSSPEGVDMRISARALENRDLVNVTRRGGAWRATMTAAGAYYLEHGHHPDRPGADPLKQGGLEPRSGTSGRRRRVGPKAADAPAGDQTERNDVRLKSRGSTNPELLIAALHDYPSVLAVSERVLPRAIKVVGALAEQAQSRGYRIGVNTRLKTPKLFLQAGKARRDIRVEEEHDQIPHKLTDEDRRALRSRSYWTPPPQFGTVPSGRISIRISRAAGGTHDSWSDAPGNRLEKQLPQIIRDVTAALEAEEAARIAAAREAEERQARWARKEEEKRKTWEAAMDRAKVHAAESLRRRSFRGAHDDWAAAGEIRRFCDALETTLAERTPQEQHNLARWISWARAAADEIDVTRNPAALAALDFAVEPGPDDLRPFLGGWSPHRPDKEHTVSAARTPPGPPLEAQRASHHGMRGQPSWWR